MVRPMILSLRDKELARLDCERLVHRGVDAMPCSVHHAAHQSFDADLVSQAKGFILTSQQAAYALPADHHNRPVFAVGRASASAARHRGYRHVFSGPSDGAALAEMILSQTSYQISDLCWLRARKISFDITKALAQAGYQSQAHIVYEMRPERALPHSIISAFDKGKITGVMALSKAQLSQFQLLLDHHDLWHCARACHLYAVSESVAKMAEKAGWTTITTARRKRAISVQAAVIIEQRQLNKEIHA